MDFMAHIIIITDAENRTTETVNMKFYAQNVAQ